MQSLHTGDNSAAYGAVRRRTPALEGPEMEFYPPTPIPKLKEFKAAIDNKYKALADGTDGESYLSFSCVTPQRFKYIDCRRDNLRAARVRFNYLPDIETLILKVPSEPHERAQAGMGHEIRYHLRMMRLACDEVMPTGSTTYHGRGGSVKEPDSSYKNLRVRSQVGSWPLWVVEGAMSESLERLHGDASWWINHSNGEVKLVILVCICRSRRTVKIETWIPERRSPPPGPRTRARGAIPTLRARKDDEVEMDFSANTPTYRGPPALVFQFSRLVGRPPNPPAERDVILTRQKLLGLAENIWRGTI